MRSWLSVAFSVSMGLSVSAQTLSKATFGAGCFWCVEAIFQELKGVDSVLSGYAGGELEKPTYKQVCSGLTGHAEVVQILYDPQQISFEKLLEVFWQTHDPTTLNRQGNDIGTQYRSVIFYHADSQRKIAYELKEKLNQEKVFPKPIVTEISPIRNFHSAEKEHQDYYDQNPDQAYCRLVIRPKLEKFRKVFSKERK